MINCIMRSEVELSMFYFEFFEPPLNETTKNLIHHFLKLYKINDRKWFNFAPMP